MNNPNGEESQDQSAADDQRQQGYLRLVSRIETIAELLLHHLQERQPRSSGEDSWTTSVKKALNVLIGRRRHSRTDRYRSDPSPEIQATISSLVDNNTAMLAICWVLDEYHLSLLGMIRLHGFFGTKGNMPYSEAIDLTATLMGVYSRHVHQTLSDRPLNSQENNGSFPTYSPLSPRGSPAPYQQSGIHGVNHQRHSKPEELGFETYTHKNQVQENTARAISTTPGTLPASPIRGGTPYGAQPRIFHASPPKETKTLLTPKVARAPASEPPTDIMDQVIQTPPDFYVDSAKHSQSPAFFVPSTPDVVGVEGIPMMGQARVVNTFPELDLDIDEFFREQDLQDAPRALRKYEKKPTEARNLKRAPVGEELPRHHFSEYPQNSRITGSPEGNYKLAALEREEYPRSPRKRSKSLPRPAEASYLKPPILPSPAVRSPSLPSKRDGNPHQRSWVSDMWVGRMKVLLHACTCRREKSSSDCPKGCSQAKDLLKHIPSCTDMDCTRKGCYDVRCMISHFRVCSGSPNECPRCQELRTFLGNTQDHLPEINMISTTQHRRNLTQQRLLLIDHIRRCKSKRCAYTTVDKMTCGRGKKLLSHMLSCKDQDCLERNCLATRRAIDHFRKCKNQSCVLCRPVREKIKDERKLSGRGTQAHPGKPSAEETEGRKSGLIPQRRRASDAATPSDRGTQKFTEKPSSKETEGAPPKSSSRDTRTGKPSAKERKSDQSGSPPKRRRTCSNNLPMKKRLLRKRA